MAIISGQRQGSMIGQMALSRMISNILGGGKSQDDSNPSPSPGGQAPQSEGFWHPPMATTGGAVSSPPAPQAQPSGIRNSAPPPAPAPDQFRGITTDPTREPSSSPPSGAIDRALQQKSQDPAMLIHSGIAAANDPSLPLAYEDRMHILDKLLRAKHGQSDGEWSAPQQSPQQAQGQIAQGKQQGGNASGIIGTVAALL